MLRKHFLFYLVCFFTLSFITSILVLDSALNFMPNVKKQLTEKIQSKISVIGSTKNLKINISYGQPILELQGVQLKKNGFVSGTAKQVKITISLLQSLLNMQPRISAVKIISGDLTLLVPNQLANGVQSKSRRIPQLVELNNLKLKLENINVVYDKKKRPLVVKNLYYKGRTTKRIDAEIEFDKKPIQIKSELTGAILDWRQWSGFSYIKLSDFDTKHLAKWLPVKGLPDKISGEYWVDYNEGKLDEIQGKFKIGAVKTPLGIMNNISGQGQLEKTELGYHLLLQNLIYKYQGKHFEDIEIDVNTSDDYQPQKIQISGVDFKALQPLIEKSKYANRLPRIKRGYLNQLILRKLADNSWQVGVDFKNVAIKVEQEVIENLTGQFYWEADASTLYLDSQNVYIKQKKDNFNFPKLILNLEAIKKDGKLLIRSRQNKITLNSSHFIFDVDYNELDDSPILKILFQGRVNSPNNFVKDINHLPFSKGLKKWLMHSIGTTGEINVRGLYRGPINSIDIGKNAVVEVESKLNGIHLDYQKGWPAISEGVATIDLKNDDLKGNLKYGKVLQTKLKDIDVTIPKLFQDDLHVLIHGNIPVESKQLSSFIKQSPLKKKLSTLAKMELFGKGQFNLNLDIPLSNKRTLVSGKLSTDNGLLNIPDWNLFVRNINTKVHFDQDGFSASKMEGKLFGKSFLGHISRNKKGSTIHFHGEAEYQDLLNYFNIEPIKKIIKGHFKYSAKLIIEEGKKTKLNVYFSPQKIDPDFQISIVSDLLPERMEMIIGSEQIEEVQLKQGKEIIKVELKKDNYEVSGKIKYLNGEEVIRLFSKFKGQSAFPSHYHAKIKIRKLAYKGQILNDVMLGIENPDGAIQVSLATKDFAGSVSFNSDVYEVEMDYLKLKLNDDASKPIKMSFPDKAIDFHVKSLTINDSYLGDVKFFAEPEGSVFKIRSGSINQKAMNITFSGNWAKKNTYLKGKLRATSLKPFLKIFNFDDMIRSKKTEGSFDLVWPGAPWQIEEEKLKGLMKLRMYNGLIPKLDEKVEKSLGLAKLVNLLSFSSLARKLSLDFSDINRHGLGFSTINSALAFKSGILQVKRLELDGNVLYVKVLGSLDLIGRKFNLKLHVNPYMTSSLPTIATIAGGPVAGFATWIANKAVNSLVQKRPFYLYKVSGPWDDPIVKQIVRKKKQARR